MSSKRSYCIVLGGQPSFFENSSSKNLVSPKSQNLKRIIELNHDGPLLIERISSSRFVKEFDCHFGSGLKWRFAIIAKLARLRVSGFGLLFSSAVLFPVFCWSAVNLPLFAGLICILPF